MLVPENGEFAGNLELAAIAPHLDIVVPHRGILQPENGFGGSGGYDKRKKDRQ